MTIIDLREFSMRQSASNKAVRTSAKPRTRPVLRVSQKLATLVKMVAAAENKTEAEIMDEFLLAIEPELRRRLRVI